MEVIGCRAEEVVTPPTARLMLRTLNPSISRLLRSTASVSFSEYCRFPGANLTSLWLEASLKRKLSMWVSLRGYAQPI